MRKFLLMIMSAAMLLMSACGVSENSSGGDSKPTADLSDPLVSGISADGSTSDTFSSDTSSELSADNGQMSQPLTDKEENTLSITVNGHEFSATLYDNEAARSFKERLPLSLDMSELNGNEKYCYLPESLPANSVVPSGINAGDIMLYGSDCLVFFYESFSTSYRYTPIGKIVEPDGLAAALGSGSVQVVFN